MEKIGKIPGNKLDEFRDYVYSFYGKTEDLYADFFDYNLTKKMVEEHLETFVKSCLYLKTQNTKYWGRYGFDSIDREQFRDYMMYRIMGETDLEYEPLINIIVAYEDRGKKLMNLKNKINEHGRNDK